MLAAAEESGEEPATELRSSVWRFSVPGLALGGDSLEAAEHDIKDNVLNYDGGCGVWGDATCADMRMQQLCGDLCWDVCVAGDGKFV